MSASSTTPESASPFEYGAFIPHGHNTDPPLPETDPTIGYKLNHLMIRIRDPQASLKFYIDLMGMRTVFTMNVGPFTIYYLGYPQTAAHRADLKAWAEDTSGKLAQTLGLLELYHIHGSETKPEGYYSTGNSPPHLGFGQLGFTVPDVPAAVKRMQDAGVPILKPLGVSTRESIPLTKWEADQGVGHGTIHENYKHIFDQIAFVQDPDGYIVELVPQTMK